MAYERYERSLTAWGGPKDAQDRRQHHPGDRPQDRARAVRVAQLRQRLAGRVRRPGAQGARLGVGVLPRQRDRPRPRRQLPRSRRRNTSTVYKINRATGKIMWRLGGKKSDFKLGPGMRFDWQHSIRALPDGDLQALRQLGRAAGPQGLARAHASGSTTQAKTATLVSAFTHPLQAAVGQPGQRRDAAQRQPVRRLGLAALVHRVQPDRRGRSSTAGSRAATTTTARSATRGPARPSTPPKVDRERGRREGHRRA